MKKVLSVFLVVVLIVTALPLTTFNLTASAKTDGNYYYTVTGGEATITGVSSSISGDITIPSTLGGYPVTSIGNYAFSDCISLTSVTIPDSFTRIGYFAFNDCSNLTSVTIGNSVTRIGGYAFCNCKNLTSFTIPNSVTSIGDKAFYYCSSLTSVTIDNSVTSIGYLAFYGTAYYNNSDNWENNVLYIGNYLIKAKDDIFGDYEIKSGTKVIADYAFYDCSSLTSVTIPNSVTSIDYRAFYYCSSLTSITIPDSVTSIGEDAFYGCSSLTSVTIPNSVTSIDYRAFYYCSSLTSITIPDSVTSIGEDAFYGCSSLTSVIIGNSVTSIGDWAFSRCSSLTSVTMGDSVTSIGNYAFARCSSLTSVTIPNSVTNIGDDAFYYCSSLTSVTIPNSVTSIGEGAFSDCSSLTSVTLPNSVTSIGNGAFECCDSLTAINVDSENQSFSSQDGVLFNKDKTKLVCYPGGKSGEYVIPNSVTSIGDMAFSDCSSLTSVTIPNSVTSIGGAAFRDCSSLTSITIPDSVTSIGGTAFSGCSSLTSVTIGNSVTSIGEFAFSHCSSLTSVTIPNSVTSIGENAFSECYNLTIYGYSGTVAEDYALRKAIKFVCLGCSHKNTTVHPAKASTCKVQGNGKYTTCNDCGKVISGSNKKLPLAGHKYTTKTTKATLTKNGSITKKCSVCGKVASTSTIYYPKTVSIAATTYTYTYTGKVITPAITVKGSNGKALKNGTDYTVSYASGRKNVGKYKVTVTCKGNYSGTKTFYFTINPVKTTVSKLTAGKKSIKVAISKKSTQVTGYEIQYSTSKTFKSAKTVTVKSYKTTSVNLTKLSAKKTYYVRVRTYKTVGKTKYYSAWSTAKKATTKK